MVRTEIYANRSVEENILDEVEKRIPGICYSLIENVKGKGKTGPRQGTAIWPELNVLYVFYSDSAQARIIAESVKQVKNAFPNEGIKVFQYELNASTEEQNL